MGNLVQQSGTNLPAMAESVTKSLANAKTQMEYIEVRAKAIFTYDLAKQQRRLAKSQEARETDPLIKIYLNEIIKSTYQIQEDVLLVRRGAEIRLAEDYDDGVEQGIYARRGRQDNQIMQDVLFEGKPKTQPELGIKQPDMFKYHRSAEVEKSFPGVVKEKIQEFTAKLVEPTVAAIHKIEKVLSAQIKTETKEKKKARKAAFDEKIDATDFDPRFKDMMKGIAKPNINAFTTDLINRLNKEKMKLEEIMHYADKLNTYIRRIELPQALGELGEYFLECAKALKNQEHMPDMKRLKQVNPEVSMEE
jgi:hypothetical protein